MTAFLPDDVGSARLIWMKGHRAMARRILEDSRVQDLYVRSVIREHFDFTEAWIVDHERSLPSRDSLAPNQEDR